MFLYHYHSLFKQLPKELLNVPGEYKDKINKTLNIAPNASHHNPGRYNASTSKEHFAVFILLREFLKIKSKTRDL